MRQIESIPSKSDAHRAMICGTLSALTGGGTCRILCGDAASLSEDLAATDRCLTALREGRPDLDCGESGSTLRFLLPVAAALGRPVRFHMAGRLPQRPLAPLDAELARHGCWLSPQGTVPYEVAGQLTGGTFCLPGNVSSQYVSGLLLALPLLAADSEIRIDGPMESRPYVAMTCAVLRQFGIRVAETGQGYRIPGRQQYRAPAVYQVEGDWSAACFWLVAGALTEGGVQVRGLRTDSLQGDRAIVPLLRRMGAQVTCTGDSAAAFPALHSGIEIDAAQIPDMVPALAVAACGCQGTTVIRNAGRLRLKESDRLEAVSQVLGGLGAAIRERPDGLEITGTGRLRGGAADAWGDHRIAMMAAVASLLCETPVRLTGAGAVRKSYPAFFRVLREAGLDGNLRTDAQDVRGGTAEGNS